MKFSATQQAIANSAGKWHSAAISLRAGYDLIMHSLLTDSFNNPRDAEKLFTALEAIAPAKMLIGMSFENLVKALCLVSSDHFLTGAELNRHLLGHRTSRIAMRINSDIFKPTDEDLAALKNIEEYVVWRGRYPSPIRPENNFQFTFDIEQHNHHIELWRRMSAALRPFVLQPLSGGA